MLRTKVERRRALLENWLSGQFALETDPVTLPVSARQYTIHLPAEEARDRLFAEAKADPKKQLPHWSRIWASGVALADVVLAHREALRGRRVLELGSGLGVTATAALEAGADVLAADYSVLALAFCRYNALVNVGRSPRTLRFNWRSPDRRALVRVEATGGFPVILAADVLYESRDIAPLLALIERWLAPDGTLWLAEPGRKTAQRFLYALAVDGWQGVSEQAEGPWPDGTTQRVHIHLLRRPTGSDRLRSSLGGWRS